MQLTRPIIFFDLETTGLNVQNDRIIQIGAIKLFPDGTKEEKKRFVNPTIPIPAESTAIHHIRDEDVANQPKFSEFAKNMLDWFNGCDLAGFNSNGYDIPLLSAEFERAGYLWPEKDVHWVDVYRLEQKINSHSLAGSYTRYTGKILEGAHDAMADVRATIAVFENQLQLHTDLPKTPKELDLFVQGSRIRADVAGKLVYRDGILCWAFGKHKGEPVTETRNYAKWVLGKDFPQDTKNILLSVL